MWDNQPWTTSKLSILIIGEEVKIVLDFSGIHPGKHITYSAKSVRFEYFTVRG